MNSCRKSTFDVNSANSSSKIEVTLLPPVCSACPSRKSQLVSHPLWFDATIKCASARILLGERSGRAILIGPTISKRRGYQIQAAVSCSCALVTLLPAAAYSQCEARNSPWEFSSNDTAQTNSMFAILQGMCEPRKLMGGFCITALWSSFLQIYWDNLVFTSIKTYSNDKIQLHDFLFFSS